MTERDTRTQARKLKNKAKVSVALLLIAVISITTATYAWFSLSNNAMVQNMEINVGTSTALKVRAGSSGGNDLEKYFTVIHSQGTTVDDTAALTNYALQREADHDFEKIKLWPVSSGDGIHLYTQSNLGAGGAASPASTLYYVELTFYFISDTDMDVYLNGEDSPDVASGETDKTQVTPATQDSRDVNAVKALRVSFEDTSSGNAVIWEPEPTSGENTTIKGNAGSGYQNTFTSLGTNAGRRKGTADETPVLFHLNADQEKKIIVRMWVEGQDAQCVNNDTVNIEKGKMNIQFRFCGADNDGNFIEVNP